MTIKNQQQLRNEINMLDGNVSRMCLTDDKNELNSMFEWALHRISEIYNYNLDRITRT